MTDAPRHVEETPARGAQGGTGLRWVLRISLGLVVVIFAAIWIGYATRGSHEAPPTTLSTTANSAKEAAATAPAGSATAQLAGRKEGSSAGG